MKAACRLADDEQVSLSEGVFFQGMFCCFRYQSGISWGHTSGSSVISSVTFVKS